MPTYYFDVYENEILRSDDFGAELADLPEARIQAIALLTQLAGDAVPNADHQVCKVVVKGEDQRVRYVATLTLEGAWVDHPSDTQPTSVQTGTVSDSA